MTCSTNFNLVVSISGTVNTLFIGPISHVNSAAALMELFHINDLLDVNGCHCSIASALQICMFSLCIYVFISICLFLSVSFCLTVAAPGAMANHLIPSALLRPHGTNNPYNTLLGESAVYNNPLGMYNTQGVLASFHSLTLRPEQCFVMSFYLFRVLENL